MQFKKKVSSKCLFAKHQAELHIHTLITHYKYTTQLHVITSEKFKLDSISWLISEC